MLKSITFRWQSSFQRLRVVLESVVHFHCHSPGTSPNMSFDFSVPPACSQPRAFSSLSSPQAGLPNVSQPGSPSSSLLMDPSSNNYQLRDPSGSPPSSSRQPQIDPMLFANDLSALFVDTLANQFGLGDTEQDLRKNLHGFAKVESMV